MVLVVDLDAVHERQVVDMPREVRKQLGKIPSGLTVSSELERAADAGVGKGEPSLQFAGREIR